MLHYTGAIKHVITVKAYFCKSAIFEIKALKYIQLCIRNNVRYLSRIPSCISCCLHIIIINLVILKVSFGFAGRQICV